MKAIEDTENVIITTFLAVVAILVISTPLLPFKMTYAANTLSVSISIAQAKLVYNNYKYDMSPSFLPRADTKVKSYFLLYQETINDGIIKNVRSRSHW